MSARSESWSSISFDWTYNGQQACILENDLLRVTVLTSHGAKIHSLIDKRVDRDLLYHHPRVKIRPPVFGVNVDNWWTGGIDEAIPTVHPCEVDGEELPYLGETWALPWQARQVDDHTISLRSAGVITPFEIERLMTLAPSEPFISMSHRIRNVGTQPIHFLWGLHPILPLSDSTTIQVPGTKGIVDISFPDNRIGEPGYEYEWPIADMTKPGPENNTWDFHYITGLTDGWAATWDAECGGGLGITFPPDVLRAVWIWVVNGGWRGLRCVGMEAFTGYPSRLDNALAAGQATTLLPGDQMSCDTRIIAFLTEGPICGFGPDGQPLPMDAGINMSGDISEDH
jgi:hypothetical protein